MAQAGNSDYRVVGQGPEIRLTMKDEMVPTPRRLKIATNYHEAWMPKVGRIGEFHSWHELLFAGLLEGSKKVSKYTPQPIKIGRFGGKPYIPDFSYESGDSKVLVEIKSEAALERAKPNLEPLLAAYCLEAGRSYRFVSHEEIDEKSRLAWNWLLVTRWIAQWRNVELSRTIDQLEKSLFGFIEITVGDLLRHAAIDHERCLAAVCQLLHQHRAVTNLDVERLSLSSVLRAK